MSPLHQKQVYSKLYLAEKISFFLNHLLIELSLKKERIFKIVLRIFLYENVKTRNSPFLKRPLVTKKFGTVTVMLQQHYYLPLALVTK
jgi:hypothetical protein